MCHGSGILPRSLPGEKGLAVPPISRSATGVASISKSAFLNEKISTTEFTAWMSRNKLSQSQVILNLLHSSFNLETVKIDESGSQEPRKS
jgi:hypothetical protein